MTRLKNIQRSSHIPFTQHHQRVDGLGSDLHVLLFNHMLHQASNIRLFQWTESEPGTSRQQCR